MSRIEGVDELSDPLFSSEGDLQGRYSGGVIEVETSASLFSTNVVHELCHAWDDAEGSPSLDHPDLFPPSSVEATGPYGDDDARTREAFARACQVGPTSTGTDDLVHELCGVPATDPNDAEAWLASHVYDAWAASAGTSYELGAPETDTWSLPGDFIQLAAAGDDFAVLGADGSILRVSPSTGAWWEEPSVPGARGLLDSNGLPVAFTESDGLVRLWRDGQAILEVDDATSVSGYVLGDVAWLTVNEPAGSVRAYVSDGSSSMPDWVTSIHGDGSFLLLAGDSESETVDSSEGAVTVWTGDWVSRASGPTTTGGLAGAYTFAEGDGYSVATMDNEGDGWVFDGNACDTTLDATGPVAVVGTTVGMLLGDQLRSTTW